jgi:hypothetical protein
MGDAMNEQELLEDLAYAESEGPTDFAENDADAWDNLEDDYEADLDGLEDYGEADFGDFGEDESESDMLFGEDGLESDPFIGGLLSNALGAEDEDEFLGKLFKGVKSIVKKAAPVVGKIARAAAPVLSAIPHPYAQIGSKVANVLGKLKAEGASTEDALEAVAEVAVRDRRAVPVVAGLAARTLVKNRGATMSPGQRQAAIKNATRAARTLVNRGGPQAIRALPKVAKSVRRATAAKGTPPAVRSQVLQRTAAKVAQKPALLQRLSRPSPVGQSIVQRAGNGFGNGMGGGMGGGSRGYTVTGPARICINVT